MLGFMGFGLSRLAANIEAIAVMCLVEFWGSVFRTKYAYHISLDDK